jgi:PadR family transcriptional regulator PadR
MTGPRLTDQVVRILQAFLDAPGEDRYGFEIMKASGLSAGSVYPILARLEAAGWLLSDWQDIGLTPEGRPRRRYYRLSEGGLQQAVSAVEERVQIRRPFGARRLAPRPSLGAA